MFLFGKRKAQMPAAGDALPGRAETMPVPARHVVTGELLAGPYPDGFETGLFALGCFWGGERRFWRLPGVHVTMVGYAGGMTPNPTYEEVCTGLTGHAEVVRVVYDPEVISYADLLKVFWESHNPTQGMRQGNDVGTQYRSAIYSLDDCQQALALASRERYQDDLARAGVKAAITTAVDPAPVFYYAEPYHQQYLAKNPEGYCGLAGLGVALTVCEAASTA